MKEYLTRNSRFIGPNCLELSPLVKPRWESCPGLSIKRAELVSSPGQAPWTYEAVDQVSRLGMGQSTCIGIGGDPIVGTTTLDGKAFMMHDDDTEAIIVIGEIGGNMETDAAYWIRDNMKKPVIGFIAGQTAPKGRRMGHGRCNNRKADTVRAKCR
ncbi:MAG: hypothetical protein R2744_01690 [Bacteroidales bacterium]